MLSATKCMFSTSSRACSAYRDLLLSALKQLLGDSFAWLDARGMTSVASVCHSLRIMIIFTQSAIINQFKQWTVFPSYSFCDCVAFSACDCAPTAVPVCLQAFPASQSLLLP